MGTFTKWPKTNLQITPTIISNGLCIPFTATWHLLASSHPVFICTINAASVPFSPRDSGTSSSSSWANPKSFHSLSLPHRSQGHVSHEPEEPCTLLWAMYYRRVGLYSPAHLVLSAIVDVSVVEKTRREKAGLQKCLIPSKIKVCSHWFPWLQSPDISVGWANYLGKLTHWAQNKRSGVQGSEDYQTLCLWIKLMCMFKRAVCLF